VFRGKDSSHKWVFDVVVGEGCGGGWVVVAACWVEPLFEELRALSGVERRAMHGRTEGQGGGRVSKKGSYMLKLLERAAAALRLPVNA